MLIKELLLIIILGALSVLALAYAFGKGNEEVSERHKIMYEKCMSGESFACYELKTLLRVK